MSKPQVDILASGNALGAEVGGIDFSQPMSDETFGSIDSALNEHAVLCFRQRHVTEPQYIGVER